MSEILSNTSLIQTLTQYLIKSRNSNYLEESIQYMVDLSKFKIQNIQRIVTNSGCKLKSTLITHKFNVINQKNNSKCIIFLHGLGSNRTQSLYITKYLPQQYCLFVFDFDGFGKSHGQIVTYGLKQSQNINQIIQFLRKKKKIDQFILWGRSMGAVAGLLYSIKLAQLAKTSLSARDNLSKIKGLIFDSPFSDFRQITKQISINKMNIPEFLIQFVLKSVENKVNLFFEQIKSQNYNPFNIKLGQQSIQTKIPTIFLYCQVDQIVPKEHSERIMKVYRSPFQKIMMKNCSHNDFRGQSVINLVFEYLNKFQSKYNRLRSFQCNRNDLRNSSMKKGINVESKEKKRQMGQRSFQIENKTTSVLNGFNNDAKIKIYQKQIKKKISCRKQIIYFSLNNSLQKEKSAQNTLFNIKDERIQRVSQKYKISLSNLQKNFKKIQTKGQAHKKFVRFSSQKSFGYQNNEKDRYMAIPPLPKYIPHQLSNEVYCRNYPIPYIS